MKSLLRVIIVFVGLNGMALAVTKKSQAIADFQQWKDHFISYNGPVDGRLVNAVGFAETQGKRPTMEDTATIWMTTAGDTALFGLFDGHGGEGVAQYCAGRALQPTEKIFNFPLEMRIRTCYQKAAAGDIFSLKYSLKREYKNFDNDLREMKGISGGSTAITALWDFARQQLLVANLGDSRALLFDKESSFMFATEDHKPTILRERRRIEKAGGIVAQGRLQTLTASYTVSRSFGDFSAKPDSRSPAARLLGLKKTKRGKSIRYYMGVVPDVHLFADKERLARGYLILACDGLWDVMSNEEVRAFVRKGFQFGWSDELMAQKLVQEAYDRGSGDNISVMAIDVAKLFALPVRDRDDVELS